jgi:hypothetical protein
VTFLFDFVLDSLSGWSALTHRLMSRLEPEDEKQGSSSTCQHPGTQARSGEFARSPTRNLFEHARTNEVEELDRPAPREPDDVGQEHRCLISSAFPGSSDMSGPEGLHRGSGNEDGLGAVSLEVDFEFSTSGHQAHRAHRSVETLRCRRKLERPCVERTQSDNLRLEALRGLRWDFELPVGRMSFEFEAQEAGEPVELVVPDAQVLSQVGKENAFPESVSHGPDFAQADPPTPPSPSSMMTHVSVPFRIHRRAVVSAIAKLRCHPSDIAQRIVRTVGIDRPARGEEGGLCVSSPEEDRVVVTPTESAAWKERAGSRSKRE